MNIILELDSQPEGIIEVTLSRSNLTNLLAKLDDPESRRTAVREVAPNLLLIVSAENDEDHYHSEARQPDVRGVRGAFKEDGATRLGQVIEVAEAS